MKNDLKSINLELEKRYQAYHDSLREIMEEIQKQKLFTITEYRTTIQNMALISGAIASFSLTVLQIQINKNVFLLIFGVCILLFNTLAIFSYIMWRQSSSTKKLVAMEKDFFAPLSKMQNYYFDLKNQKITEQQYLEFENKVIRGELKSKGQVPLEGQTTDNWDIFFYNSVYNWCAMHYYFVVNAVSP